MDNGFIMPRGLPYFSAFDEWVKMGLAYIDNWSLWLDLKILLKTIPAVFIGMGAS
jgi:lipopolysaccharide/colanic/teichoic acid biosynthesis glycosyltransferase